VGKLSPQYSREYYQKNKDRISACHQVWRAKNRDKINARAREQYKNPTYRARQKELRAARYKEINIYRRIRHQALRIAVFQAYGNRCVCCGESQYQFLSIDHINGNGKYDRKQKGGANWYGYLLKNHPDHVQILCYNCNMAKALFGVCPHQEKKDSCEFSYSQIGVH
jgi:hypothetical protein